MFNKFLKLMLVAFVALAIFFPANSYAQIFKENSVCIGENGQELKGPGGRPLTLEECGAEKTKLALGNSAVVAESSISRLVIKYVNFVLPYLALATFVGFIYAGFLYVTAYGAEDNIGKAKKILIYSVAGIIVVILSYGIVQLFTRDLVKGIQSTSSSTYKMTDPGGQPPQNLPINPALKNTYPTSDYINSPTPPNPYNNKLPPGPTPIANPSAYGY